MAEFPSMPLFTDAFISDTLDLDAERTGAYMMLLMVSWRSTDCEIPNDDKKLARFSRCTPRRWNAIKEDVLRFFTVTEHDTLVQKRLKKERDYVHSVVQQKRINGAKGGRPKSLKDNEVAKAKGSDQLKLNESKPKAPTPTPTPNKEKEDTNVSSKKTRGTRLQDGFEPDLQFAQGLGLTVQQASNEFEKFKDYWNSKPGAGGVKLDWQATWRNWARQAKDRLPSNGNGGKRKSFSQVADELFEEIENGRSKGARRDTYELTGPVSDAI